MVAMIESGQIRTLPNRNHVHGLTVCHASCRPGQACYHHHRPKTPAAYVDLVEPASLLVLDAPNLYRDIVPELEEAVDCLGQKAYFESDHWGAGSVIRPGSPSLNGTSSCHGSAGRRSDSPSASCRVRFRLGDFQAPFQRRPDPRPPEHTDKVSLPNTPSRPRKGPSRRGCRG